MRFRHAAPAVAAGAAVLALGLAACSPVAGPATQQPQGSVQPSGDTGGLTSHNASDTEFAQMMIIHHQGAVEMADLAEQRASSDEVKALASRVKQAQDPEIQQMTGWLRAWGEPVTPSSHGMDHGGMDMDGLDQAGAMRDLSGRSGSDFDKRFLELMTAHHQGAIEMAGSALAKGRNQDVRELAGKIVADQTAEIAEMGTLRVGLGA